MKQTSYKKQYSFFEQSLLNISSGIYFSVKDFIDIAKELDISLPFKTREIVLQKLLLEAKQKKLNDKLITLFFQKLEEKKEQYLALHINYEKSKPLISNWLRQLESTKMLIQRELFQGNIYE